MSWTTTSTISSPFSLEEFNKITFFIRRQFVISYYILKAFAFSRLKSIDRNLYCRNIPGLKEYGYANTNIN